jgi:F-type H+-transporting ATPase subunit delta
MEELIAKRYAKALSESVSDIKSVVAILDALKEALSVPKASDIIASPIVSATEKTDLVLDALGENADPKLVNFIKLLGEHDRLGLIPAVVKVLHADLQKASNRYEGTLQSAKEVSDEEIARLEKTLSAYTGATVALRPEKSDIDGLRVRVDDLGIEVNFSKERVKEELIDFIKRSL